MSTPACMRRDARARGFTLIELLVVVALLALVATLAAPSLSRLMAKKRVEGIASELATDFQYARSEAVQRNTLVRVTFGNGCYVIHTREAMGSAACSANAPSVVTGGVELKTVQIESNSTATLSPNAGLEYLEFDPARGSPDVAASVDINSSVGGWQLRAVVSSIGRVRTCSPNSSVAGYSDNCG